MYIDRQGRKYCVIGCIGPNAFKARVQAADKHGETGWKALSYLPWRKSFQKAQCDLDALAEKKKWNVWYGEG